MIRRVQSGGAETPPNVNRHPELGGFRRTLAQPLLTFASANPPGREPPGGVLYRLHDVPAHPAKVARPGEPETAERDDGCRNRLKSRASPPLHGSGADARLLPGVEGESPERRGEGQSVSPRMLLPETNGVDSSAAAPSRPSVFARGGMPCIPFVRGGIQGGCSPQSPPPAGGMGEPEPPEGCERPAARAAMVSVRERLGWH